jgi:signal transduction histidine kinase/CheY-like chemotaxis protein
LYRQGLTGTIGNLLVAVATLAVLWSEVPDKWRFAPIFVVVLSYLERPLQLRSFRRVEPSDGELDRWRRRYFVSAAVAGVGWGIAALLLMPVLPFTHQVFLIIVEIGLAAGGLSTLGEVLSVFLAFAMPILLLTSVAMVTSFASHAETLGPLVGLYIVVLIKTSMVHGQSLENALVLSLRNAALVQDLERATRDAQAASVAKGEFLTRMSHEIRTPMNGVLGATELLRNAALPPREHHLARLAHTSSEMLLALLNDVLDMARIEAGRIVLAEAPMSVEAMLDDVATLLSVQADQKDVTLVCHASADLPAQIVGDAIRLRQIVTNLAGNAVKFTDRGEIEVHATVQRGDAGPELVIEVRDTGVGIPVEQHAIIFNAFEQAGEATQIRGTGLGLAISARLAALMGGDIQVESRIGAGSRFTLRVPCHAVPDAAAARPAPALAGVRVALLAPQPLERQALSAWLTAAGADVATCVDPPGLTAARPRVDAFIIDPAGLPAGGCLEEWVGATPTLVLERASSRVGSPTLGPACRVFPRPLQRSRVVPALSRVLGRGAASRATGMDAPRPFAGVRVLVVDDDAINRTIAEHMIAGLGGAVAFASDGRSALANLATESFDLVLMDCEMPDLDGGTVTRLARERGVAARRGGPVPIVAVTAHVMPQHHELCYAAGMDGVLTKPLTAVAVASTLGRFISADGAAAAAMN